MLGITAAALSAFGATTPVHAEMPAEMRGGGFGPTTLQITTTTDTLPGTAAIGYLATPGQLVVRTYNLTNASEATLVNVTISDPDALPHQERDRDGVAVRCGAHSGPITLAAWSSIACEATFPAVAGTHRTVITARATAEGTGITLEASDVAGYRAGSDTLALHETFDPGSTASTGSTVVQTRSAGGQAVHVRYAVAVSGPVPLIHVSIGESLPVTGLTCPPDGPIISSLSPATEAHCAAELFTLPGVYTGVATAAGTESFPSISPSGPGPAREVRTATSSRYELAPPPVSSPPTGIPTSPIGTTTNQHRPHPSTAKSAATTGTPQPSVGSVPIVLAANPGTNTGGSAKQAAHSNSGAGQANGLLRRNKHPGLSLLLLLLVVLLPAPVTLLLGHGMRRRR